MTNTTPQTTVTELWNVVKKEITGIQLLWEAVNGLYFQPYGECSAALERDTPLLFRLAQTALMESLLMRVSRLMDPAATGRLTNLSLKQLVVVDSRIDSDEAILRGIWDDSELKRVRDKYLSHNDLTRALTEDHTPNIPMEPADIGALSALAEGLRTLRRSVNQKLTETTYLDQGLDVRVQRELGVLNNSLLGGEQFFKLLPDHEILQSAWQEVTNG